MLFKYSHSIRTTNPPPPPPHFVVDIIVTIIVPFWILLPYWVCKPPLLKPSKNLFRCKFTYNLLIILEGSISFSLLLHNLCLSSRIRFSASDILPRTNPLIDISNTSNTRDVWVPRINLHRFSLRLTVTYLISSGRAWERKILEKPPTTTKDVDTLVDCYSDKLVTDVVWNEDNKTLRWPHLLVPYTTILLPTPEFLSDLILLSIDGRDHRSRSRSWEEIRFSWRSPMSGPREGGYSETQIESSGNRPSPFWRSLLLPLSQRGSIPSLTHKSPSPRYPQPKDL